VGKFKILEVKKTVDLDQAIEEIHKELSSEKISPVGQFNLEHIKTDLEKYLKKYNGPYQLEEAYIQISGNKLALYYHGGYDRQEITDKFFGLDGEFTTQLEIDYFNYYKDYLTSTINDKLKEKGQTPLKAKELENLFSDYYQGINFSSSAEGVSAGQNPITTYTYKFKNVIGNKMFVLKAIDTTKTRGRIKHEAGHDSNDIREAAPIIIALSEFLNKKVNADELGLDDKQVKSLIKDFTNWTKKDFTTKSLKEKRKYYLYHSQASTISEVIRRNLLYKVIVRGKNTTYGAIREKGRSLFSKENDGKTLSVDKYTPADFIMTQSAKVYEKDSLGDYNNLFANDLLKTGGIGKVSEKYKYIGISQKEDAGARGGRSKELFTILQPERYGKVVWDQFRQLRQDDISNMYEDLNKRLSQSNFIELEGNNGFTKNQWEQKYTILKILEGLVTNNKKHKTITPDAFLEMVKFSMAAWEGMNPCFYKIIGEEIEAFNNERFELSLNLNLSSKITIRYSDTTALLIIPIFISMDTGEGFLSHKMYSVKLPFEVSASGVSPNIQSIEEIEEEGTKEENRVTMKSIVMNEIGMEEGRTYKMLSNMGYSSEEIEKLKLIFKNETWKTWFKEYKRMVYKWITSNLNKIKNSELKKEITQKINLDLKDMETGEGSPAESSIKYQNIRNLLLSDDSGVSYEKATSKFIFESLEEAQNKITEIIDTINNME